MKNEIRQHSINYLHRMRSNIVLIFQNSQDIVNVTYPQWAGSKPPPERLLAANSHFCQGAGPGGIIFFIDTRYLFQFLCYKTSIEKY